MFAKRKLIQKPFNVGEMSTEDESKSKINWSGDRKDNFHIKFPQLQALRIQQTQVYPVKKRFSTQEKTPLKSPKKGKLSFLKSRVKSQNLPMQEHQTMQTNEEQDFEKFYSIGKKYWNIDEQKIKEQRFDQLPYIKKTSDKYLFNTKYFFPKRKSESDREQFKFNKLKKKCIDNCLQSQRVQSIPLVVYDKVLEQSIKKSIKKIRHFGQGDYINQIVDQIYHDEYQTINSQLKMIHRIKQRHNIIQKIKDQRRKLIDRFNTNSSEVKLQPII